MVDLRKSLLLLIVVAAMASVANAQLINPALQCTANAGVPPIVRAEGLAEQVGDLVLNCTGGTPTPAGQPVPQVNVQIFLNVNITSRLLADPWSEALLLIDEPGAPRTPPNPTPPQLVCGDTGAPLDGSGTCPIVSTGNPAQTYDGTPGALGPPYTARPNIFQGRQAAANSIVWLGVPFDPPGTTVTRILRITNIRARAAELGAGTLIPNQIIMWVSISGATSVPVNNPQQVVAFVRDGMSFSLRDWAGGSYDRPIEDTYQQCVSANCGAFRLRFSELFATAFKTIGTATQSVPGAIYNTESMLTNSAWPPISGRGNLAIAGRATQGTRLMARFTAVPAGVRLFVTIGPVAQTGGNAAALVGTDSSGADLADFGTNFLTGTGAGSFCASHPGWPVNVREVALDAARSGVAVWEVTAADASQIGSLDFGVLIRYTAATGAGLPALGTAVVNGTYAPLLPGATTASATAPVPRFVGDNPQNAFTIIRCETNLLWPYVTNQAGFDTGMVIANTSRDPYGTEAQEGPCTIYYYGATTGGGAAPAPQTTGTITAGTQAIWTLSSGGNYGIAATPGFQGYVIARCQFRFAHGYAFISDFGASKLAQGYLALILDFGGLNRTGQTAEALNN